MYRLTALLVVAAVSCEGFTAGAFQQTRPARLSASVRYPVLRSTSLLAAVTDEPQGSQNQSKGGRFTSGLRSITSSVARACGTLQVGLSRVIGIWVSDVDLLQIVSNSLAWLCWGALLLSALGTLGVDIKPILGLSTLFGFALSISTKNILR